MSSRVTELTDLEFSKLVVEKGSWQLPVLHQFQLNSMERGRENERKIESKGGRERERNKNYDPRKPESFISQGFSFKS